MWYFIIWAMLANGEVIKEEFDFPTYADCVIVQQFEERQMAELGEGFIVTRCKRDTSKETY